MRGTNRAEGAYLEPDVHYGAAYLNALSRAIHGVASAFRQGPARIAIVGHDANRNGAQMLALNIGQTLVSLFGVKVCFILNDDGPLLERYQALGSVYLARRETDEAALICARLRQDGYSLAITNTSVTGDIVPALKTAGFRVLSLIHELPNLLKSYDPRPPGAGHRGPVRHGHLPVRHRAGWFRGVLRRRGPPDRDLSPGSLQHQRAGRARR